MFFPLAATLNGGTETTERDMQQKCIDELGKTWWEDAPRHLLGAYPTFTQDDKQFTNRA